MWVILGVTSHKEAAKPFAGVVIGATVAMEAIFAGPISGASMNPARSFGPAVISGTLQHLWIYWVATIGGAILAMLVWQVLNQTHNQKQEV